MNQNLCPFCFELMSGNDPCPHCGHRVGEPMQGIQQLPVGWILDGKYRIGMTLGQGGFGITYLAYDMNLQQKVAIKEYFPGGLVTRSAQTVMPFTQSGQALYLKGVDAFYREARLLAQFSNHPNIVHIQNFFRENNTAYFVMEYVKGKSLASYLDERGGRLSFEEILSLLTPVMDALDVLHQAGILHRDIAPDNIYLTENGTVKLLDFGAAKNELSQHTHSSAAILKPGYAPLEQYSVTGNQGPWTDIYAMGAVIYRCLTGTMPPDSPDRITGREIIPISASGAKVSKNVEAAVMKALSLNIPDRWQRMSDFNNALTDPNAKAADIKQDKRQKSISAQRHKRNKREKTIIPFLIPACIIVVIAITWLIITVGIPNYKYNSAVKSMNSGNYDRAITAFSELGFYKDSQQKISDCNELRFKYLLTLLSTGTTDNTVEAFNILEDYSDRDHYEKAINHEVQVLMEMEPENAAAILEAIDYDDAVTILENIGKQDHLIRKNIFSKCDFQIQRRAAEQGDILTFGAFEQNNNKNNGPEPVRWKVLSKDDSKLLLTSVSVLDAIPYNDTDESITWETCTLRKWLNEEFYQSSFTQEEKTLIMETENNNFENKKYGTVGENKTKDYIFLLSIEEAKKYFRNDEERLASASNYAKRKNVSSSSSDYSPWWLRSPGNNKRNNATTVSANGYILESGVTITYNWIGIRPCLWINSQGEF